MKRNTPAVARAIELVIRDNYSISDAARATQTAVSSVRRALRRLGHAPRTGGRPVKLY